MERWRCFVRVVLGLLAVGLFGWFVWPTRFAWYPVGGTTMVVRRDRITRELLARRAEQAVLLRNDLAFLNPDEADRTGRVPALVGGLEVEGDEAVAVNGRHACLLLTNRMIPRNLGRGMSSLVGIMRRNWPAGLVAADRGKGRGDQGLGQRVYE